MFRSATENDRGKAVGARPRRRWLSFRLARPHETSTLSKVISAIVIAFVIVVTYLIIWFFTALREFRI